MWFYLVIRLLDKKESYVNFKYELHNSISESFYTNRFLHISTYKYILYYIYNAQTSTPNLTGLHKIGLDLDPEYLGIF